MRIAVAALSLSLLVAAPAVAQTPAAPEAAWRDVAPENLLVIDTTKGRILVELDPRVAPQAVARVRTLADQGFYDGLKWHRVLTGFMAQTGDPLGTGAGGSELPDVPAEFTFRRGRDGDFVQTGTGAVGITGLYGSLPVVTQPNAQMMVTADFKTGAQGLFCTGVAGMARAGDPNSANSQFFLMMDKNDTLNGAYTPFGRVLQGLEVVRALNAGPREADGAVPNPDIMTRARTAAAMPAGERPSARVMRVDAPAFAPVLEARRAANGAVDVCAVQPVVEITPAS